MGEMDLGSLKVGYMSLFAWDLLSAPWGILGPWALQPAAWISCMYRQGCRDGAVA